MCLRHYNINIIVGLIQSMISAHLNLSGREQFTDSSTIKILGAPINTGFSNIIDKKMATNPNENHKQPINFKQDKCLKDTISQFADSRTSKDPDEPKPDEQQPALIREIWQQQQALKQKISKEMSSKDTKIDVGAGVQIKDKSQFNQHVIEIRQKKEKYLRERKSRIETQLLKNSVLEYEQIGQVQLSQSSHSQDTNLLDMLGVSQNRNCKQKQTRKLIFKMKMDQFKKQSHKREPKVSAYEFSDNMSRNYKTIMSIEAKINSNKVVDADKVPACRYLENIKEIQHLRLIYIDVNIDRNLYIRQQIQQGISKYGVNIESSKLMGAQLVEEIETNRQTQYVIICSNSSHKNVFNSLQFYGEGDNLYQSNVLKVFVYCCDSDIALKNVHIYSMNHPENRSKLTRHFYSVIISVDPDEICHKISQYVGQRVMKISGRNYN